jgi:hypothetical protein
MGGSRYKAKATQWGMVQRPPFELEQRQVNQRHDAIAPLMCSVGPRTQGQRYQTLCQKENDAELIGQSTSGTAAFINRGLGIEADMYGV